VKNKCYKGLNGVGTAAQKNAGIVDSEELFLEDTRKSGRGKDQPELVELLVHDARESISFLEQESGLNLSIVTLLGGHSRPRTHRASFGMGKPMNVGFAIISAMEKRVRGLQNVEVRTDARVTRLLTSEDGKSVVGVEIDKKEVNTGESVILATGGYSTDSDGLLAEFTPQLRGMPSTNGAWKSAGDGVRMGRQIGAQLNLMDAVNYF
jgi:succinate dehydrogenase/fumarate reductase flavoprotein subunit